MREKNLFSILKGGRGGELINLTSDTDMKSFPLDLIKTYRQDMI